MARRLSMARRVGRIASYTMIAALMVSTSRAQAQSKRASATGDSTTRRVEREPSVSDALRRKADKHGVWGSLGIGRGRAGLDCATCASATSAAYGFHGTLGMRVSPRFLIGAETFVWMDVVGGGVDRIARGSYLIGRSYPFASSRMFLHGGLGVASFEVNDGAVAFLTRSPSLSMALGYDWQVAGLTVTPTLTAIGSTGGRLESNRTGNAVTENARLGFLRTAVALSWYR
ncbi:MAG: hypothetical protein IT353_03030 [Gemmatimonadaceae bacterium]|nr:hypothetical protein [Gemmatimonadaceae bacterium]